MKSDTTFVPMPVVITLRRKMSKKAPRFVEFNFKRIAIDRKDLRRTKEERQIYKSKLHIFFIFAPGLSFDLLKFSDDFTPFLLLWKTITKSLGKTQKSEPLFCGHELNKCSKFHEDSPSGKKVKFNHISRVRLNFRRQAILSTALHRNPMQASSFGGTFDELFVWIFYALFTEDASQLLPIPWRKNVKNDQKTPIKGSWLNLNVLL